MRLGEKMAADDSTASVNIPLISPIQRFTGWVVFKTRYSLFFIFGFGITFLLKGAWIFPSIEYFFRIARDPFTNSLAELPGAAHPMAAGILGYNLFFLVVYNKPDLAPGLNILNRILAHVFWEGP